MNRQPTTRADKISNTKLRTRGIPKPDKHGNVRVLLALNEAQYAALRSAAIRTGRSLSDLLREGAGSVLARY